MPYGGSSHYRVSYNTHKKSSFIIHSHIIPQRFANAIWRVLSSQGITTSILSYFTTILKRKRYLSHQSSFQCVVQLQTLNSLTHIKLHVTRNFAILIHMCLVSLQINSFLIAEAQTLTSPDFVTPEVSSWQIHYRTSPGYFLSFLHQYLTVLCCPVHTQLKLIINPNQLY